MSNQIVERRKQIESNIEAQYGEGGAELGWLIVESFKQGLLQDRIKKVQRDRFSREPNAEASERVTRAMAELIKNCEYLSYSSPTYRKISFKNIKQEVEVFDEADNGLGTLIFALIETYHDQFGVEITRKHHNMTLGANIYDVGRILNQ